MHERNLKLQNFKKNFFSILFVSLLKKFLPAAQIRIQSKVVQVFQVYLRPTLLSIGISPTFAQQQARIQNNYSLYFSEPWRVF